MPRPTPIERRPLGPQNPGSPSFPDLFDADLSQVVDLSSERTRTLPKPDFDRTRWIYCLSGGAAHGAFQVGVLQYLKDDERLYPVGVAGTSVSAIHALKIGEATRSAFDQLKTEWLWLRGNQDMWDYSHEVIVLERSHLREGLEDFGVDLSPKALVDSFAGIEKPWAPVPSDRPVPPEPVVGSSAAANTLRDIWIASMLIPLALDPGTRGVAEGVLTFGALGVLPTVLSMVNDVDNVARLITRAQSFLTLAPLERRIRGSLDVDALRAGGIPVRLVSVALEDRLQRVVTETGDIVRVLNGGPFNVRVSRTNTPLAGTLQNALVGGALASAAVPLAFPPVRLVDADGRAATCIDGGAHEAFPVDEAIHIAEHDVPRGSPVGILAIGTSPPEPHERREIPPGAGLVDLGQEELACVQGDVKASDRRELQHWSERTGNPALIIEPWIKAGSLASIDVGRTQIQLVYGWMLAHDHISHARWEIGAEQFGRLLTTAHYIAKGRLAAYHLERQHVFVDEFPRPVWLRETIEELRGMKRLIAGLVQRRTEEGGAAAFPPPNALEPNPRWVPSYYTFPVRVHHWYHEFEPHTTSAPYRHGTPPVWPDPEVPQNRGEFRPFDQQFVIDYHDLHRFIHRTSAQRRSDVRVLAAASPPTSGPPWS